jgi:hypothetical protein
VVVQLSDALAGDSRSDQRVKRRAETPGHNIKRAVKLFGILSIPVQLQRVLQLIETRDCGAKRRRSRKIPAATGGQVMRTAQVPQVAAAVPLAFQVSTHLEAGERSLVGQSIMRCAAERVEPCGGEGRQRRRRFHALQSRTAEM